MTESIDIILVVAGLVAVALAVISGIRLAQRLKAKRYWSSGAFAVRLVLSGYFIYVFFRLALF